YEDHQRFNSSGGDENQKEEPDKFMPSNLGRAIFTAKKENLVEIPVNTSGEDMQMTKNINMKAFGGVVKKSTSKFTNIFETNFDEEDNMESFTHNIDGMLNY